MLKTRIRIAEINIEINHFYKYIPNLCKDYIIDETNNIDMIITISEDDINEELDKSKDFNFPAWYVEAIICYRKICHELYKFEAIMIHASAIEYNNKCFLFTAKPGTGKTTHTRLLFEYLKDQVHYVNGDKPILRKIDGIYYVYGTPWNGKENLGSNVKVPMDSLVFLERGSKNVVTKFDKKDLIKKIIVAIIMPEEEKESDETFRILSEIIDSSNTYLLKCNMEKDAPIVSATNILKV